MRRRVRCLQSVGLPCRSWLKLAKSPLLKLTVAFVFVVPPCWIGRGSWRRQSRNHERAIGKTGKNKPRYFFLVGRSSEANWDTVDNIELFFRRWRYPIQAGKWREILPLSITNDILQRGRVRAKVRGKIFKGLEIKTFTPARAGAGAMSFWSV